MIKINDTFIAVTRNDKKYIAKYKVSNQYERDTDIRFEISDYFDVFNVKGYVVSMYSVRVGEAISDKVVTNHDSNSCSAGYRSNYKYYIFNKAIEVNLQNYTNNLIYESIFPRIMKVNDEGKNFSYIWNYYHTVDGIYWDSKTSKLYLQEMLNYSNEL